MVRKSEKGQGLVEFALVISLLVMLAVGGLDFAFKYSNMQAAQDYAHQAARQASIYLNSGGYSCDSWVRSHMSQPVLLGVDPGGWTLTLTGCPTDPSWSQVSGSPVTATLTWHQDLVWWSETGDWGWLGRTLANGSVTMKDFYQ